MKASKQHTKVCLFSYSPHLDGGENLERISAKYQELSRHIKDLSPVQERMRELYETLLLLLFHVDWDQPYAVDLERIFAKCLERGRFSEHLSRRQRQEILITTYLVTANEALRMHKKALTARDWGHIDYTLRQLGDIHRQCDNQVYDRAERRVARLRKYRQSGRKAKGAPRRKGHNWDEIYRRYDELMSQGSMRYNVTSKLSHDFGIRKDVLNRGLSQRGRGSHSIKQQR